MTKDPQKMEPGPRGQGTQRVTLNAMKISLDRPSLHTLRLARKRSLGRTVGALCTIGLVSIAAGCGDDDKTTTVDDQTTTVTADSIAVDSVPVVETVPAVGEISFVGQWARTSPAMASAGAMYVTITSTVDDNLIAATVDASVAARVEVHETVAVEDATDTTMMMGSDTTTMMGGDEMTMRPVAFVELPAGVAVELNPGGYHIMLIDLVQPLEVGASIQVTLVFERAGEISIEVPVLDEAP